MGLGGNLVATGGKSGLGVAVSISLEGFSSCRGVGLGKGIEVGLDSERSGAFSLGLGLEATGGLGLDGAIACLGTFVGEEGGVTGLGSTLGDGGF